MEADAKAFTGGTLARCRKERESRLGNAKGRVSPALRRMV
jgi:hypothetical protein